MTDTAASIPIIGEMYKPLVLHSGGKVPKTGEYRLKGGEVVLNKTQQAQLRKAKTAKTKQKIISSVKKRKPLVKSAVSLSQWCVFWMICIII